MLAGDSWPHRGDVWWVDFTPARGSEQSGRRPALVISRDEANRAIPTVVVAAITSQLKHKSPVRVRLNAGQPLEKESVVLAFQVMTLAQDRLERFVGQISRDKMIEVDRALRASFGL